MFLTLSCCVLYTSFPFNSKKLNTKQMKIKGLRWWVVGLVALAAVINYIDRQAFGALWPDIANDLFPEMDKDGHKAIYGTISTVFIL